MSTQTSIHDIFHSFAKLKVLVIGDAMLDHYVFGDVLRISSEAPIPIVDVQKYENRLGGAANVALNVQALGAKVFLASVFGDDSNGHVLKEVLSSNQINSTACILNQERRTTVKTRVVSRNQQIVRYDYEDGSPINEQTELALLDNVIDIIYNETPDVVILQDYNKGVLTPKVIANVIHNCTQNGIPVAVDPKHDNFWAYKGCTLFKPNREEAMSGLDMSISANRPETLMVADNQIRSVLKNQYTIITLSDKGIFVGAEDDHELVPAYYRKINDVSGAGDTVISLLALGLALNLDIFATAELANIAAGLVCEQVGVSPIDINDLIKEATLLFGDGE